MTIHSNLWESLQLGASKVSHRIDMAPLTWYHNDDENVPLDMVMKYYADRACVPGTIIITEATGVSPTARLRSDNQKCISLESPCPRSIKGG